MEGVSDNGTMPVEVNYILNVLNYINELNDSQVTEKVKCDLEMYRRQEEPQHEPGCEVDWDTLLCWPHTPPGSFATLPCFEELNGIQYDKSQNASRWCRTNGTWDKYSNYTACVNSDLSPPNGTPGIEMMTMIYFIGYSFSLFTLIIAVSIFLYYKELRCLRNSIHTNLMFSYIMADLMWILTAVMQISTHTDLPTCITILSILQYFYLTNFFWMFVEGLYLYLLVVKTFTGDNIKLRLCLIIGWGTPLIVTGVWGMAKSLGDNVISEIQQEITLSKHCPWMAPHPYDWFYIAPTIVVLCMNVIFLFMIMWVLITKLRSANNVETQQYRKATKALLVLIPLLGVTYILFIAGPTQGDIANVFGNLRATLLSFQGLSVALFYCFLNTEVQNTVRHHFSRWSTARNLGTDRRYYSCNNWSPRSRTESIRLYCQPSNPYRKRESTVSETTTTTVIGANSATAFIEREKKAISEDLNE